MSTKPSAIEGFGFDAAENESHFVVLVPRSKKQEVTVYELPTFDETLTEEGLLGKFIGNEPLGKVRLPFVKWQQIEEPLRRDFNARLRHRGYKKRVTWMPGVNRLHRLFGKELCLLAWAIEDAPGVNCEIAVANWLGLRPEERWWLYAMTNAATGHPINGRGRGWRKALRFALSETPLSELRFEAKEEGVGGICLGEGGRFDELQLAATSNS